MSTPSDRGCEIASGMGETLESIGIAPPVLPPLAPVRPSLQPEDLVDLVVCAAAEAIETSPRAVRASLLAAFDRAAALGLTLDELRTALRTTAAARKAKKSA